MPENIIDWNKVEANPEKDWKIVGQLLIDNRNKIEALERELAESERIRKDLKTNFADANSKIKDLETKSSDLLEKNSEIERQLEKLNREKRDIADEMQSKVDELNLKIQKITDEATKRANDLNNKLEEKIKALEITEERLKNTSDRDSSFTEMINEKNKEISDLSDVIEEKNKEIAEINKIIDEKNDLIERISKDLKINKDESLDSLETIKSRDAKILKLEEEKHKLEEKLNQRDIKIQDLESKIESLTTRVGEIPIITPPIISEPPQEKLEVEIPSSSEPISTKPAPTQPVPAQSAVSTPRPVLTTPTPPSSGAEVEWKDTDEMLKIFLIDGEDLKEVEQLDMNQVGIIMDKQNFIIWVWKGEKASRLNAIRASSKAPSIRSSYRLYDWKVEFIDEGEEPEIFPAKVISS